MEYPGPGGAWVTCPSLRDSFPSAAFRNYFPPEQREVRASALVRRTNAQLAPYQSFTKNTDSVPPVLPIELPAFHGSMSGGRRPENLLSEPRGLPLFLAGIWKPVSCFPLLPSPVGPPARVGVRWVTGAIRRVGTGQERQDQAGATPGTLSAGAVPGAFPGADLARVIRGSPNPICRTALVRIFFRLVRQTQEATRRAAIQRPFLVSLAPA
jgi:hypothetical protein